MLTRSARVALFLPLVIAGCSSDESSQTTPQDAGVDRTAPPAADAGSSTRASVVTYHNDNLRTGANTLETILTPQTVSSGNFALLFARAVQGFIYAEPLVVSDLAIGGTTRDVVFVATQHNEVYAFDAQDPASVDPLWHVSLGPPVPNTAFDGEVDIFGNTIQPGGYTDVVPELGITSTPVIDVASQTLFVFAQSEENGVFFNRVHALSLVDGSERSGSPIVATVSANGSGPEAVNGVITIPQKYMLQRPALAIDSNVLWIAGGGHGDFGPYHGWVLAYDRTTLALLGTFMSTPDGIAGGIWQSGAGIAIDEQGAGYCQTGNGTWNEQTAQANVGDSFVKVKLGTGGMALTDWFTPFDHAGVDPTKDDADIGSSGPLLLPGTNLLVGGGKDGKLYLLQRDGLGHSHPTDDSQIVQSFYATTTDNAGSHGWIMSSLVYWEGQTDKRVYLIGQSNAGAGNIDPILAYRFTGATFDTTPYLKSTFYAPNGTPGGAIALSANGKQDGILWALTQADDNGWGGLTGHAALHAFDAEDLTHELYSSMANPNDQVGLYSKFAVPTIANGKVYVGGAGGALLVFGLKQ